MLSKLSPFNGKGPLLTYSRLVASALHPYSTLAEKGKCPATSDKSPPRKLTFSEDDYQKAKPFKDIPGPSGLQFIARAALPWGQYYGKDMAGIFRELQKEYGDVIRLPAMMGRPPMYVIVDANEAEVMFRNEGATPFRRTLEIFDIFRQKERPDLFGENCGLIQDQGKTWQSTRTKVNPIMMQPKTVKLYLKPVEQISNEFVARIRSIRDANNEMPGDFQNELNKWALESISYIALNQRLGLVGPTDKNLKGQQLISSLKQFLNLSFKMEFMPSIWRYYETPNYKRIISALHSITNIITEYIDQAIEEFEKKPSSDGEESVLQKLLKIDKKVAIVMALDMMMAGVDTTANTTAFLLYALATNPEKQAILRQEIMQILPEKDSVLTEDAMKNMPYLRACMKESSRMRATVIGTARRLPVDIVMGGYQIPKYTDVAMASIITSVTDKYFERPDEFLPERFLKSQPCPELKATHPFAFIPFGFGARMCIGRRLAELEMEILVSKLIRNFEIQWTHPALKVKNEMINSFDGELKFKVTDI